MEWYTWVLAIVIGLGLGLVLSGRKAVNKDVIHIIKEDDFRNNMRKGQLVDIRKKEDFDISHIKGARNFKGRLLATKYTKLRRDQSVYLYCSNGKKSYKVAKKMSKDNFRAVYVLENGFNNLEEKK